MLLNSSLVLAGSYAFPAAGNDLIGAIQYVEVQANDTLLDIARRYDLGYNEITAANPGIDSWLPGRGTRIVVPTRFILPPPPWNGIVINLAEMRLYYFPEPKKGEGRQVITHPIGIGREGWATPVGDYQIVMKIEHPSWTMPDSVYAEALANGIRQPRRLIPPGPDNPLGEYAMKLGRDGLFIHGTNKPYSIGMRVSYGCLRLYPEDIRSLVMQVPKGTPVRIVDQPYKFGIDNDVIYLESHAPIKRQDQEKDVNLTPLVSSFLQVGSRLSATEWDQVMALSERHTGIPIAITNTSATSFSTPH
jgi:L,D-transpeptidase ErfK/SrfK